MRSITLSYPFHEYESKEKALEEIVKAVNDYLDQGWKIKKPIKEVPDHFVEDSYHDEFISRTYEYFVAGEYTAEISLDAPLKRTFTLSKVELQKALCPQTKEQLQELIMDGLVQ